MNPNLAIAALIKAVRALAAGDNAGALAILAQFEAESGNGGFPSGEPPIPA